MRRAKILMVEDEDGVAAVNREYLEEQGYETARAASLAEARGLLPTFLPDVILLDVMLPDGMGWDLVPHIRENTNAPVVYLTSRDENESVVRGLLSGGDDYIVKPYDLNVLGARVKAQLRRAGFAMAGVIHLPPLSVDMLSGTARLGGESIHMSQTEIQLLGCFAMCAGRCMSVEELYRRVWGEPVGSYERTVSVYVSRLRQKLRLEENGLFEIRATADREYIFSKLVY